MNAADEMGLPLTHFVTINLTMLSCSVDEGKAAFFKLRNNRFGKWVTRKRVASTWNASAISDTWVFENPNDKMNVHWAVHIPEGGETVFCQKMPEWLMAVTGGPFMDGALDIRPIHDVSRLSLYMLKGASPQYTDFANIRHEPQGVIDDRRGGVSRSLNRAARKKAGINGQRRRGKNRAFYQKTKGYMATSPTV